MALSDITILFLTANKVPEGWAEYQKSVLLNAADGAPIITISRKPLNWGINVLDTETAGISNIYKQMLVGAKLATTDYIGIAEDDTLYPKEHFEYRPPLDTFAYNLNRYNVFAWGTPMFSWKDRYSNSALIAPRKLLIETLEERFAKWPQGTPESLTGEVGRPNIEDKLGISHRHSKWFETEISIVRIDHRQGVDRLSQTRRKGMGGLRAIEIPYWGTARDIINKFV